VADLIDPIHHNWNQNMIQRFFENHITTKILSIPVRPLYSADKLIWSATIDGQHTVRSNYYAVMQSIQHDQSNRASTSTNIAAALWKRIWTMKMEPKIKTFLWSACHNALATRANLFQQHIIPDPFCALCHQQVPESLEHLFFHCPWTCPIWFDPQINIPLSSLTTNSFDSWLTKRLDLPRHLPGLALVANTLWQIWRMRNNSIFRNQLPDPSLAIQTAMAQMKSHQIYSPASQLRYAL